MKKQPLLNTYVNNISMTEAIDEIQRLIESRRKSYVVAINVDVIIKIENSDYLKRITDEADLTIVDGKPLIWISHWHKQPIKSKISGSDLVPELCKKAAEAGYKIFIVGGREGIGEKARINMEKQYPGIQVVGTYAPPYGFENREDELKKLNQIISDSAPDILIVCFGCPKQEMWVYENYQNYNATISICAGGTVDFLAGNVRRAPAWMSEHGLEWFYRFIQEPRRMFKRYFIEDMQIFRLAWKYRENYR